MIAPMLSKLTEHLPSGKDYIYEIKLDGQRTIAEVGKKSLLLYTRNFQNVTAMYPELADLAKCLRKQSAILDGEIVALENGIPSFQLLQQRMSVRDPRAVHAAMTRVPILYYIFDILELNGKSLLKIPLTNRKKLLEQAIRPSDVVKILPHFPSGDSTVQVAQEFGYEGVVAKKAESFYFPGQRSGLWQKYKFQDTDSFVLGGWMEGGRSRNFGSLLVGKYQGKDLIFCGRVGTGFDEEKIRELLVSFDKIESPRSPFREVPKNPNPVHWLKPKLVVEVKFKEWTNIGSIRAPVFLGLRPDQKPRDCRMASK